MTTPFPTESQQLRYTQTTEADFPQLLEVYNSNPFYMEISEGKPVLTLDDVRRDFHDNASFEHNYAISIRQKQAEQIIGLAQFILNNPRDSKPWLGLLIVHQAKQGEGIAKEFMQTLKDWYRENGYEELRLGVLEKNIKVQPFYEKLGFVQYEVRETEKLGRVICLSCPLQS